MNISGQIQNIFNENRVEKARQLCRVEDRYDCDGFILLRLIELGRGIRHPKSMPIAYQPHRFDTPCDDIAIRDHVIFTAAQHPDTRSVLTKVFAGHGRYWLIDKIQYSKPNVVSLDGWKKLLQNQTKFSPRQN